MGLLNELDTITGKAPSAAPEAGNSFSQGMRQGLTSAGGQLHALAGGVGEALGADNFAQSQYAQSKAAQELAATQAPAVTDWRQVTNAPDLSTGLRNAGSYVAGLAGQSLPMVGLGLGAGAVTALSGGGAIPALAAGTAAMAPFETGGAIERQQADPAAVAGNTPGQRLKTAALEGTARAAAMNVVPQLMGGKLLGSGIGAAGKGAILAEGIGGNALAGAGAEKVSTLAEDSLNPNRDTSGDNTRMVDAAVGGAALGVPFAGVGLAGHALHGGEAAKAAPGAEAPAGGAGSEAPGGAGSEAPGGAGGVKGKALGLLDKMKTVFTKDAGDDAAQKIAAGRDVASPEDVAALKSASPEQQGQMLRDMDARATETTQGWAQELMKDGSLSDENRAALQQAAQDLGDKANRAVVAGIKLAQDGGKKALDIATSFMDAVLPKKEGTAGRDVPPVQKSEVSAGARQAIADVVAPHVTARFPALADSTTGMDSIVKGMHALMQKMMNTGRVNADAAGYLQKMFGRDTTRVLTDLHDQVLDNHDPDKIDNYFRAVNQLDTSVSSRGKLIDMMRSALPEDMRASNDQLNQMADHLREYVSGATLDGKTPEQGRAHASLIESALKEHFGDKADDILEAARVGLEMEREKDTQDADQARAEGDLPEDHIDYAGNSDDGFAEHGEAGVTTEQDLHSEYFGGRSKDSDRPMFMEKDALHRQNYGTDSPASKKLREVSDANPDKNVSYVTAHQYALDHGAAAEDLRAMGVKGDPKDYVLVKAEGQKREGLKWSDVDRMRLDTHRFPDSESRIETESGEHKLDALKVAKFYAQKEKLPFNETDVANPYSRLRRRFVEALGALSDHLGEPIHMQDEKTTRDEAMWLQQTKGVHDDTVIAYRQGKPVTWGEVRQKGRIKLDTPEDKRIAAAYKEREEAIKAGDVRRAGEMDAELTRLTEFKHYEPEHPSVVRANAAAELGAAKLAVQKELLKAGPTQPRGETPANLRRMALGLEDMVERMQAEHGAQRQGDFFHDDERALWAKRAENLRALADNLEAAGPNRPYTPAERRLINEYLHQEKKSEATEERLAEKRRKDVKGNIDDPRGPMEGDPFGNVHEAADLLNKRSDPDKLQDAFGGARNMEAGPEGNMLHADNFFEPRRPNKKGENIRTDDLPKLPREIVSAIDSRVNRLESGKSAMQRALGAKGRDLLNKLGSMRQLDAAELASIVKEKDDVAAGKTINALAAKYKGIEAKPPKQTFVNRVVGKGDVSDVIRAIKVSDDTHGIQRAITALAPHQHDASARAVLDAANERMESFVEKNPDATYNMQRVDPAASVDTKLRGDIKAHIEKVLGKSVDVEFAKMLHAGEFYTDKSRAAQGLNADVIRISTHSLDPFSTAYHESLHAFIAKLADAKLMDEAHPLMKAANSEHVLRQLHELLKGEPDALKQLDDPHERAAYMYQFWAADKLKLAGKPAGVLGHIAEFFKKTLGIWTNDQRAEHIMNYFHSGEYAKNMGERNAVARVLMAGTNPSVDKFSAMVKPLARLGMAVAATGDARLRSTGIKALADIADHVYAPLHGEHGADVGYLPAARAKRTEVMNLIAEELGRHDPAVLANVMMALQRGEDGTSLPERRAVASVRKVLKDTHAYMLKAKVNIGDLGEKYFPRVWDAQTILRHETEFRDMLEKYRRTGDFKGSTDAVMATLTRTDGADLQAPTIKPGMQSAKERVLHFIDAKDAEPFLNKNLFETLNSYMTQATRRAEWAKRFGDDNAKLHAMMDEAKHQGATDEHLQLASDYLQGVDGTLGDHIDPKWRRAFGNAIVYQNLRLLPLAIFSSLIDPLGISVRGGTLGDAFHAMKRGFAEIPKGFKKDAKHDTWTQLAATIGTIDSAVLQHNIGTSFSQGMTSNLGRKLNDKFFKFNLMEQFNTSMRVAATKAAVGFMARHAAGDASPHSARWLAELGFKPGEIRVKDGMPMMKESDFVAAGMKPKDAAAAADKMTLAINKWVDGAILRPNAAHKPVWMNDPHWAVVAHLKQFVYSFQETILKRVGNEVKHGNVGPAYALAAYVPFMLAADSLKGMIQGGGEQPDWKKGWGASDYLAYEMQRAGLFGVGQFAVDTAKDLHRGGLGIGALVGPTAEQLGEAAKTIGGAEQFGTFALNAMPANALFDAAGNASASTNAVD